MNQVAIINTFRVSWISSIIFFTKTEKILMNDTNMRVLIMRAGLINMNVRGTDKHANKDSAKTFCKIYEVNIELRMVSKPIN